MYKAPFVHKFETENNKYILDVNTNHILAVDDVVYDLVDYLDTCSDEEIECRFAGKYTKEVITDSLHWMRVAREEQGIFSSARPKVIRYPHDTSEIKKALETKLTQITLEVTERCNLRCKYCIYSDHYFLKRSHGWRDMSQDTAKAAIDYFLPRTTETEEHAYVTFYGGEPLMNFRLIKWCVDYAQKKINSEKLFFHVTTNGTLLTPKIVEFLVKNKFGLTVSLDGPREMHDANRRTVSGRGSFDIVIANLKAIKEKYPDYYSSNVTFNMVHAMPRDWLRLDAFVTKCDLFMKDTPIMILTPSRRDTSYYDDFNLDECFDLSGHNVLLQHYIEYGISNRLNSDDQMRDLILASNMFTGEMTSIHRRQVFKDGFPEVYHPGNTCIPGMRRMYVTINGSFYICERGNCTGDTLKIGDVHHGIDVDKVMNILEDYTALTDEECRSCWVNRCCSMCPLMCETPEGLDKTRKLEACNSVRENRHNALIIYCTIVEKNPNAFEFTNDIQVS